MRQVFRDGLTLRIEIYSTMGLSDCPDDIWATLDADALTEENGAMGVQLNGPRYWVLNNVVGGVDASNSQVFDFGGLEMIQTVQLEIPVMEATSLQGNYNPNEVQGSATFVYTAGSRVYELVSPEGDVYRMQSYSQSIDPSLTLDTLENLGDQLDLPDDWQFQTSVLTEDSEVSSADTTVVVQDELGNSYVKVSP